jgi:hypothetical protein
VIRTERAPEPPEFDAAVRRPGRRWLDEHPASRSFPPHWRKVSAELEAAFHGRCAYTAMALMGPGTVDHFVSLDEDPTLAYEWHNFRHAAGWINSKKSALRSEQILDPCEIGDDWFELLLPGCELIVTERCPEALRGRARFMLRRLGLDHGRDVVRCRKQWLALHEKGLPLSDLDAVAPLVARAVRKAREQPR